MAKDVSGLELSWLKVTHCSFVDSHELFSIVCCDLVTYRR